MFGYHITLRCERDFMPSAVTRGAGRDAADFISRRLLAEGIRDKFNTTWQQSQDTAEAVLSRDRPMAMTSKASNAAAPPDDWLIDLAKDVALGGKTQLAEPKARPDSSQSKTWTPHQPPYPPPPSKLAAASVPSKRQLVEDIGTQPEANDYSNPFLPKLKRNTSAA